MQIPKSVLSLFADKVFLQIDSRFNFISLGKKNQIPNTNRLEDIVFGEDLEQLKKYFEIVHNTDTSIQRECRMICTNGTVRWFFLIISHCSESGHYFLVGRDIDDEKRRKVFFEILEKVSGVGCWEINLQTQTLLWSDRTYEIHDADPSKYKPRLEDGLSFFPSPSKEVITQAVQHMMSTGEGYDLELEFISLTGRKKHVRAIAKAYFHDGKIARCVGTFSDITDKKVKELEMQIASERFYALADNAPLMLSFFNEKGQFEWVNKGWTQTTGWDMLNMVGVDVMERFYPDEKERQAVLDFMLSPTGEWRDFLTTMKDGSQRYTSWTNVKLSNGRSIGIGTDIHEARLKEIEVEIARAEIQNLFNLVRDPLCIANSDGFLLRVNPAMCEILGYSEQELCSRPYIELVHPEDIEKTLEIAGKVNLGQQRLSMENRYRTKSGEYRIFAWNTYVDLERKLLFAAVRDVTDERNRQLQLINSANLASLGEMASGIAHEINNPLAIIKGKAESLYRTLDRKPLDLDKIKTDIQKIEMTVERISKIVSGLRKLARGSQGDPIAEASIKPIFDEVFLLCKERFANNKIDLQLSCDSSVSAYCRPLQLEQVLVNLLNNAFDAVLESDISPKWVRLECSRERDRIIIRLTDCGLGIPQEVLAKIMQPFFTTKPVGKGTGLGLSISKALIEEQNGQLYYNSKASNTQFIIELRSSPPPQIGNV